MTGKHLPERTWRVHLPIVEWAAIVLIAGLLIAGSLAVLAALREPTPARTVQVTVTVPGPTVTVSYLILRTVTPGVNGF